VGRHKPTIVKNEVQNLRSNKINMEQKIKAIIFDASVLIKEDAIKARHTVSVKFNLNEQKFKEYALKNLPLSYVGKLHYNDFFKNLIEDQGIKADSKEMAKEWIKARNRHSKINNRLLKELKKLNNKFAFGLLANSTILNDKAVARKRVYRLFTLKVISYRVNCKQPEKEIYELLIKKLKKKQIDSHEILFMDHKEENLKEAEKLGIKTFLFKDNKSLIKFMEGLR
jgi:FMN phosphatase YigB (HAD superfamily)